MLISALRFCDGNIKTLKDPSLFSDETNITDIAQLIRGLRYVTVVNNKTDKEDLNPRGLLQLKVVTLKPGQETFELIKKEAMATIPTLKKFKYSTKQLQKIEEI